MKKITSLVLVLAMLLAVLILPHSAVAAAITQAPTVKASVSGKTVNLTWSQVIGATSYEIECYTLAGYQQMVKENGANARYFNKIYGVKTTQKSIQVSSDGDYVFSVAAVNATSWKFSSPVYVSVGLQTKWLHGIPVFRQTDSRWANVKIGSQTIGQVGCTLTALSMSESYRLQKTITPKEMRYQLSFDNNLLRWPSNYYEPISYLDLNTIYTTIKSGRPVIVGAQGAKSWHWIIVTGYQNAKPSALTPAMFSINDPSSSSRVTLADFLKVYSRNVTMKTYR